VTESAQIPVFVAAGPEVCPAAVTASISARIAPVSTVSIATASDPLPRFVSGTPGSDCQTLNDCGASYYPVLTVDTAPVQLTGNSLGGVQSAYVRVGNTGPGRLDWSTSVSYESGSNWLTVTPSAGANGVTLQFIADPAALKPGTYKASVTVSAGIYGKAS